MMRRKPVQRSPTPSWPKPAVVALCIMPACRTDERGLLAELQQARAQTPALAPILDKPWRQAHRRVWRRESSLHENLRSVSIPLTSDTLTSGGFRAALFCLRCDGNHGAARMVVLTLKSR